MNQQKVTIVFNNSQKNGKFQQKRSKASISYEYPAQINEHFSEDELFRLVDKTFPYISAVKFVINKNLDSGELTLFEMCKKHRLLIILESTHNLLPQNKILYWINNSSTAISFLWLNNSDAMNDFIIDFIMDSFVEKLDVKIKNSSENELSTMNNLQNTNLLMRASSVGNEEIFKELLKMPFDVNQKNQLGHTAADLALKIHNYDILLLLLENNSTFPRQFNSDAGVLDHKGIKELVSQTKSLHLSIEIGDEDEVNKILLKYPGLIYLYDTKNQSAAAKAIKEEKFEIYKLLSKNGRCIGPLEDDDDILEKLNVNFRMIIRDTHAELSKISEGHITTILGRCVVSHDDQNVAQRYQLIFELFKDINELSFTKADGSKIPFGNFLLRLISANGNFKTFFDFNRTSVHHMNPYSGDKNTKAIFTFSGNIYIGAKELLNKKTRHETIGATVHEFNHFANLIIFDNSGKPYEYNDEVKEKEFAAIIESYKKMKHDEDLVGWVFGYDENLWTAELIVRPPHMMAHYYQNSKKLSELRQTYEKLFDYYEEFFTPQLILTMNILEKLTQNDSKIQFSELTEPLKDKIIYKNVDFQGQSIQLIKIVNKTTSKVLNQLQSSEMLEIINKMKKNELKIGKIVEIEKENQEIYIERDFVDFEIYMSWANLRYDNAWLKLVLNNVKTFENVARKASNCKLLLLSDEAGAGKSTSFKHLTKKLKEKEPTKWVSYVDLKRHLKVYKDGKELEKWISEDNLKLVVEVLKEILEINCEFNSAIFNHLFNENKVILLFDGVDEISPKFKEFFINLILKIQKNSNNQIWIATRPQHMNELREKLFVTKPLKIFPFTENQKVEFIEKILRFKETEDSKMTKIDDNHENSPKNHSETAKKIIFSIKRILKTDNLSNPFLLQMFAESYLIDKKINNSNLFSLYQKVIDGKIQILNEEKGPIANADRDNQSRMTIWEIHEVFALKQIFEFDEIKINNSDRKINLSELSIMRKWKNEKSKWSPEKISRYGLLYVDHWDTENEIYEFVHRTIAEFFVAKYFITNIYEFGDENLSYDEAEKLLVAILSAAQLDDCQIVFHFIISYFETATIAVKLNKQFINCLQGDWLMKLEFNQIMRILELFWHHEEILKILLLPKCGEKTLFQRVFKDFSCKNDSMNELIDFLEKRFGEYWIDLTGYKKINEKEKFQHLSQKDLEMVSEDETWKKIFLKTLNFIPQMQIPREHFEKFINNNFYNISRLFDQQFQETNIYKRFKECLKSNNKAFQVNLSNIKIDGKIMELFQDLNAPETDFFKKNVVENRFNIFKTTFIWSILINKCDLMEFYAEKLSPGEILKIITEDFFVAISQIDRENLEIFYGFSFDGLKNLFPPNLDENGKKMLKEMLTKLNYTNSLQKISLMNFLSTKIEKLKTEFRSNNKIQELKFWCELENTLTDLYNLHCKELTPEPDDQSCIIL